MSDYEIRGICKGDLAYLAQHLRPEDVSELEASRGHRDVLGSLRGSVAASSEVFIGSTAGAPLIIYGVVPDHNRGIIWAVATPEIKKFAKAIVLNSRPILRRWFQKNPSMQFMCNYTHAENVVHHRWLEWCGAQLLPEVPYGARGELFKPFIIKRRTHV